MPTLKHGHARSGNYWEKRRKYSREYTSWLAMRQRCLDPKSAKYERYGGRGINICKAWLDSFNAFISDMGICPEGFTLGRRENDGSYCPENCQWEDKVQQANNRSNNRLIESFGKKQTIAQWAEELGMGYGTLQSRISRGWPLDLALNPNIKHRPRQLKQRQSPPWKSEVRHCFTCGEPFTPVETRSKCCTQICRKKMTKKIYYRNNAEAINARSKARRKNAAIVLGS